MKLKTFIELFGQLNPEVELYFYDKEGTEIYIEKMDWGTDESEKVTNINFFMNEN